MNALNKARKLVQQSINNKWIPILKGETINHGIHDCPLCTEYFIDGCKKCPIYHKGYFSCVGTPIEEFESLYEYMYEIDNFTLNKNRVYELHAEINAAAQMEIDFLKQVKAKI